MRRLIIVAMGFVLAVAVGSAVLTGGLAIAAVLAPVRTSRAVADVAALFAAALQAGTAGPLAAQMTRAVWRALMTVCVLPLGLTAVLGEVAGWRRLGWLAGATALVSAAVPLLWLAATADPGTVPTFAGAGPLTALLFLTGLASGATYWAVAGAPRVLP